MTLTEQNLTLYAQWSQGLLGDADGNGTVNATDALLILRHAMCVNANINLSLSDVDGNGTVNATDALLVLRMAMGVGQ